MISKIFSGTLFFQITNTSISLSAVFVPRAVEPYKNTAYGLYAFISVLSFSITYSVVSLFGGGGGGEGGEGGGGGNGGAGGNAGNSGILN